MRETRENDVYLPGFPLPAQRGDRDASWRTALEGAEMVLSVMPSHLVRGVTSRCCRLLDPSMLFVSATKGLENGIAATIVRSDSRGGGTRSSSRASRSSPGRPLREKWRAASPLPWWSLRPTQASPRRSRRAFSGPTFRLYTNPDPVGVEIGGAVKNVVAIGAGVCHGLGLGQQRHGSTDHTRVSRNDAAGGRHGRPGADAGRPRRTRRPGADLHRRLEPQPHGRAGVGARAEARRDCRARCRWWPKASRPPMPPSIWRDVSRGDADLRSNVRRCSFGASSRARRSGG